MKTLPEVLYKRFFIFFCCILTVALNAGEINLDSLKKLLTGNLHDTSRCRIYYILAEKADEGEWQAFNQKMNDLASERYAVSEANSMLKRAYASFIGSSYANFAYINQFEGTYDKAIENLLIAQKYLTEAGNSGGLITSNISLGAIYQRKNDLFRASEYYRKAEAIAAKHKAYHEQIEILNNLGVIFKHEGNMLKAIEYIENGLRIAEREKDSDGMARSLYNLSLMYGDFGDFKKSKEYVWKSLKLSELRNDKLDLSHNLTLIGGSYQREGKLDSALYYYQKGLKLRMELGDKRAIAMSNLSIGRCYVNMNRANEALSFFETGLKLNREIGDKEGIAQALQAIGEIYMAGNKIDIAELCFVEANLLAESIKYLPLQKGIAYSLYQVYKLKGKTAQALSYHEQYIQLNQKIITEESKKAMMSSEFKLAYEKKEQAMKLEQEKRDFIHRQEAIQKQNDLQKQKVITYAFMGGFVLLIALIYVVFRNLKQSKQANAIISEQKKEVELKNVLIETKQTEILDSINYAKRIQYTLLAHEEFLSGYLKDYFIYYQPKDIVSGDFYWATFHNNRFYLAVCDSTGHGVPGAFMSLLNISFLNEAINEKNIEEPGAIFDYVRKRLMENMSREGQKDGFDGILACFDIKNGLKNFRYAAANNAPLVVSNGQLLQLPGDRMPVGIGERQESFKTYTHDLMNGDMLYLYTDGYADQFGGPKGKKFMYRRLNDLLKELSSADTLDQKKHLSETFLQWKGNVEQIDDVCILGIKL